MGIQCLRFRKGERHEAKAWVFEAIEGEDTWADVPEGIRRV